MAHYRITQDLHNKVINLYYLQGINQKCWIKVTAFDYYLCYKKKDEQKRLDFPVLMDF